MRQSQSNQLSKSTKMLSLVLGLGGILFLGAVCTKSNASVTNRDVQENANIVADTNKNTNTNSSEVDTSDWLTYTNEEYGFNFRYPKEWEVKIEETQLKSRILPNSNIYVIQLLLDDKIKLVILPEGQLDHGLETDMKRKELTIDDKDVTLVYSDKYQVYLFTDYPQKDSEFRTESHATKLEDQAVIETVLMSIDFNS